MSWYNISNLTPILMKYKIELIALSLAVICIITAGVILVIQQQAIVNASSPPDEPTPEMIDPESGDAQNQAHTGAISNSDAQGRVVVEISGSVMSPGLYTVEPDTRIGEIINQADGLSKTADTAFIARNINQAKPVVDGEKIHIPSLTEVQTGRFQEPDRYLQYLTLDPVGVQPADQDSNGSSRSTHPTAEETPNNGSAVSINNATAEELETLPGIGEKTAEKIIAARPFSSLSELTEKSIVYDAVYAKIQDQIQL